MLWIESAVNHKIAAWRDSRMSLHAKESGVLGVKPGFGKAGESSWRDVTSRVQDVDWKKLISIPPNPGCGFGPGRVFLTKCTPPAACEYPSVMDTHVTETQKMKEPGLVGQGCNSSYPGGLDRSTKSSGIFWAVGPMNSQRLWLHEQDQTHQYCITEVGGIRGPTSTAEDLLAAGGFCGEGESQTLLELGHW